MKDDINRLIAQRHEETELEKKRRKLENVRVDIVPLLTPKDVKFRLPLENRETIINARQIIEDILLGKDHRKLAIVGPCSIHNPDSALEYARRLLKIQNETSDKLLILMRTYFEKPRTNLGWRGYLHDPDLDGSDDFQKGIMLSRKILVTINKLGVPCATEILDPNTPQFFADCISWGAIGARTVESQIHRQVASGMSMPIGMKNGTSGDISVAINAIKTARAKHSFSGVDEYGILSNVRTDGNPNAHLVLRGGTNGPNFDQATIESTRVALVNELGLRNGIVVDCSHDQTLGSDGKKDFRNQIRVAREIVRQIKNGQQGIGGIAIESHIKPDKQTWDPNITPDPDQSMTDACLGWDETEEAILNFADSITV